MDRTERLTITGLTQLATLRGHIRALLSGCDTDEVIDAMLVADELCGLVCQYGNVPAEVTLTRASDRPGLRVAVVAPLLEVPVPPVWSRAGARVLQGCATDWGMSNRGTLMTLWASVRLRSRADLPVPRGPVR